MRVKVTKLSKNKNTFKTPLDKLVYMPHKPEVNRSLYLYGRRMGEGITTSKVEKIEETDKVYVVYTINSIYKIEKIIEEGNNES